MSADVHDAAARVLRWPAAAVAYGPGDVEPLPRDHTPTRDDDQCLLALGDWVHVSPGTPHWHGAVPDDTFEHLAVTATGGTQWYGPVDGASYRASMPVT